MSRRSHGTCDPSRVTSLNFGGLACRVLGPESASNTCVLLHGFGAPGDDLVSLGDHLGGNTRYVFPAAPLAPPEMYGGRAWWMIDLAALEADLRRGGRRDRSAEIPDGLVAARTAMLAALDAIQARYAVPDDRLVLGGFSQGAMLSLDVALHRDRPLAGLALMSGTLIAETEWTPRLPTLAGVPVVMSHGRADPLLPFAVAETLRDKLTAAGANVTWVPFSGGHEIPGQALAVVATLLR
jgi:phospholipase/carboxylesterase